MHKTLTITLLFLILGITSKANMAQPIYGGTMMATPFTSKYVDILHETINIKLYKELDSAYFDIEYQIQANQEGEQIPLLFYAINYNSEFQVWIDGEEVKLENVQANFNVYDKMLFSDFKNLFAINTRTNLPYIRNEVKLTSSNYVYTDNLFLFYVDVSKGKHTIKVKYIATPEIDGSETINKYSIYYSLVPAKYWKSFGSLEINIDTELINEIYTTNIGKEPIRHGHIESWRFNSLPFDFLKINYHPQLTEFQAWIVKINASGFGFFLGLLLMIAHIFFILRYRKNHRNKRFSWVMITGSILVPIITFYSIRIFANLIKIHIPHTSFTHNIYIIIFIIFSYMISAPIYFILMWLTDRIYRRKILKAHINS